MPRPNFEDRVAMAKGKQGIWLSIFPDRENIGNLGTTQGNFGQFVVNCPFND